jgi:alkanesulfonate monooxygenase SsuD/methylene tetrahydromethanopterin reductase-like flavin-dependent oxidoreductase (luciferase family)
VTFEGKFDAIDRGNINPRPSRPIPIWIGGFSEPAFRRAGRLGDGFIFAGPLEDGGGRLGGVLDGWKRVQHHLAESGRSGEGFGADWVLSVQRADDVVEAIKRWQDVGGTHASVVTMGRGFDTTEAHLDYIADVAARLDL